MFNSTEKTLRECIEVTLLTTTCTRLLYEMDIDNEEYTHLCLAGY